MRQGRGRGEVSLEAAELVDSLTDEELALRLDSAINLAGAELYLDRSTTPASMRNG